MLKKVHLNSDLRILNDLFRGVEYDREKRVVKDVEVTEKGLLKGILKALILVAKLVVDIRTNQTTIMKAQGIALVEPRQRDEGSQEGQKTEVKPEVEDK